MLDLIPAQICLQLRGMERAEDNHWQCGNLFPRMLANKVENFPAATQRKEEIERNKVWGKIFDLSEGLIAIEGWNCQIPSRSQVVGNKLRNVQFVFDNQDTFHAL